MIYYILLNQQIDPLITLFVKDVVRKITSFMIALHTRFNVYQFFQKFKFNYITFERNDVKGTTAIHDVHRLVFLHAIKTKIIS